MKTIIYKIIYQAATMIVSLFDIKHINISKSVPEERQMEITKNSKIDFIEIKLVLK